MMCHKQGRGSLNCDARGTINRAPLLVLLRSRLVLGARRSLWDYTRAVWLGIETVRKSDY